MKGKETRRKGRLLQVGIAGVTIALGLVIQANAQIYTLNASGTSAGFDLAAGGLANWIVQGADQVKLQAAYYRVGPSGPELPLSSGATTSYSVISAGRSRATYTYSGWSIQFTYSLVGGMNPTLSQTIDIRNNTGAPLNVNFFQYSDFDIGGVTGDQTVNILQRSGYDRADQYLNGVSGASQTIGASDPAVGAEAAIFGATLGKLQDLDADTLSNVTGAGPDDVTWAFHWNLNLTASGLGSGEQISTIFTVPEPSFSALALLGALVMFFRRAK